MAEFFFSVPGGLTIVGLGILLLARRGAPRSTVRLRAPEDNVRLVMQIVVSAVILSAGLWVMLSGRYGADAMHWAAGAMGTVVGYWLKP
jgi:hypothetical protein